MFMLLVCWTINPSLTANLSVSVSLPDCTWMSVQWLIQPQALLLNKIHLPNFVHPNMCIQIAKQIPLIPSTLHTKIMWLNLDGSIHIYSNWGHMLYMFNILSLIISPAHVTPLGDILDDTLVVVYVHSLIAASSPEQLTWSMTNPSPPVIGQRSSAPSSSATSECPSCRHMTRASSSSQSSSAMGIHKSSMKTSTRPDFCWNSLLNLTAPVLIQWVQWTP